jgi:hypothetical protein
MEPALEQDHSIQADVWPVSRFLRFVLASISVLILGNIICGVTRATGMFAGGRAWWFRWDLGPIGLIVPLALIVGIAAATYPRRWLSHRHNAFIVAAAGAAAGCLSCLVLLGWVILQGHIGQLRYGWKDLVLPLYLYIHVVTWLIVIGASAMLVTLTRRTLTVLVAVAVLCVLAVVLPSPIFNFVMHNQELTVAMVVPVIPGASAAKPPRGFSTGPRPLYQADANAVAAHVLEALRKAGLPGPYRVAEIDRLGRGKKSLQIIVFNPPVPAHALLPQPDGTELIYISQPDGWHTIPAQAPTLGRSVEVTGPRAGLPYLATYCVTDATGYGPCPAVRPE